MLLATREIYEITRMELLTNTDEEMNWIKYMYVNNKRNEIINSINFVLKRKPKNCRGILSMISRQDKYKNEFMMYADLNLIQKIVVEESFEKTSFYDLSSVDEIYKKYKLVYLLLMRIALRTIIDIDYFLTDIMNIYNLLIDDLVFVATIENIKI